MLNFDLEELKELYNQQRPRYESFAKHIEHSINRELRQRKINFIEIKSRVKEVDSFLKKAIRKKYSSPIEQIRDKAGVRVTVTYPETIKEVSSVIDEIFHVNHRDDKILELSPNELGYLGVHFEVGLKADPKNVDSFVEDYANLVCEIQLRTQAQSLWANVSHELLYKPADQELPTWLQRNIYRLIALVELFDSEVANARDVMHTYGDPPQVQILKELENDFRQFTDKSYDKELSLEIIEILINTFGSKSASEISGEMDEFISFRRDKLQQIFDDYERDKRRSPLLFQPEAIMIFERLEHNEFILKDTWKKHFSMRLLQPFEDIWRFNL